MTNILASIVVCIVTNVTTASNESGCKMCSAIPGVIPAVYHSGGFVPCAPWREATEKTQTTTVKEVTTIRFFTFDGVEWSGSKERVLRETVKRWKRKDNWEEE